MSASIIDQKKAESEKQTSDNSPSARFMRFFQSFIGLFLFLVIYFSTAACIVYASKVAQVGLLPDDTNCYPFAATRAAVSEATNQPLDVPGGIPTSIFTTMFSDPQKSKTLRFSLESIQAQEDTLAKMLLGYSSTSTSSVVQYLVHVTNASLAFFNGSIRFLGNLANIAPEFSLLLFGPWVLLFAVPAVFLLSGLFLIYTWFANMTWFFRVHSKSTNSWSGIDINPLHIAWGCFMIFVFSCVLFWAFPAITCILGLLFLYAVGAALSHRGKLDGRDANVGTVVIEMFRHYKISFVSSVSAIMLYAAFRHLGTTTGAIALAVVALVYFGYLGLNLFRPPVETLADSVPIYKIVKECKVSTRKVYDNVVGQKGGAKLPAHRNKQLIIT